MIHLILVKFIQFLFILPLYILLWCATFLIIRLTLDVFGIDLSDFFSRDSVDIPDSVNNHCNSEIVNLFKERR